MAIIRTLKSFLGKSIYPKTVTKAIYDGNNRLDQMITNGLSNPNILINGNFRHPVNQRGETILTGSATDARYTIDRWALLGENAVFNVFDNYITLRKPKASLFAELYQLLEFPATYNNRPLTLTVSFKGTAGGRVSLRGFGDNNSFGRKDIRCTGNVQTESITFTPKGVSEYLRGADIVLAEYNGKEYLPTSKDYELTLYWAKLEDGEYTTPFRPKRYDEELRDCQRFYQILSTNTVSSIDMRPLQAKTPIISAISGGYSYDAEL